MSFVIFSLVKKVLHNGSICFGMLLLRYFSISLSNYTLLSLLHIFPTHNVSPKLLSLSIRYKAQKKKKLRRLFVWFAQCSQTVSTTRHGYFEAKPEIEDFFQIFKWYRIDTRWISWRKDFLNLKLQESYRNF